MKPLAITAATVVLCSCVGPQTTQLLDMSSGPLTSLGRAVNRFESNNGRLPVSVRELVDAGTGFDPHQFSRLEFRPHHDGSVDYYVESKRLDDTGTGYNQVKGWIALKPSSHPAVGEP